MNELGELLTLDCGLPNSVAPVYHDVMIFSLSVLDIFCFPLQVYSPPLFYSVLYRLTHVGYILWSSQPSGIQLDPANGRHQLEARGRWKRKPGCLFPSSLSALPQVGCVPSIKHKAPGTYLAIQRLRHCLPLQGYGFHLCLRN